MRHSSPRSSRACGFGHERTYGKRLLLLMSVAIRVLDIRVLALGRYQDEISHEEWQEEVVLDTMCEWRCVPGHALILRVAPDTLCEWRGAARRTCADAVCG